MTEDGWRRRAWLRFAAGACLVPAGRAARATGGSLPRMAAAWEAPDGSWHAGLLGARGRKLEPMASMGLPTRGHGLTWMGDALLVAARRPGDWLLCWSPGSGRAQWKWIEPDRAFNGHVLVSADGKRVFTTESDLGSGAGLVGVRDARSLEKLEEWPTAGVDPHALLLHPAGGLLVANGGIPTDPDSGRIKLHLERMDPSLVRLGADGTVTGQWRLADRRLSIRHLALMPRGERFVTGAALQAEHDDPARRAAAPVLAVLDASGLRAVEPSRALGGYGGDIARFGERFAVGCPRAGGVATFDVVSGAMAFVPLDEACALAPVAGDVAAAGRTRATGLQDAASGLPVEVRLDNHWVPALATSRRG